MPDNLDSSCAQLFHREFLFEEAIISLIVNKFLASFKTGNFIRVFVKVPHCTR